MREKVGASIVEIITESLYDKPIVIFREYVQNSADSLKKAKLDSAANGLSIEIWRKNNNLCFLDNGTGIPQGAFVTRMSSIADSDKSRRDNIGYKGIGRLSGLSYCTRLQFINILDYQQRQFQTYTIDCAKYVQLRKDEYINSLEFSELMEQISTLNEQPDIQEIHALLAGHEAMFETRKTGFLVVLEEISRVLSSTISDKNFLDDLCWLLPVPFKKEMLISNVEDENGCDELFRSISSEPAFSESSSIPAEAYLISYNGEVLQRPIERATLRKFVCQCSFERYAICVHNFSNEGIAINNKSSFSGIRLYIDNILLCNETELIPALQQFGMLSHPVNETIQTVRGIGAIIYIVDKISLSANARRTFIDVTDNDSLRFLQLIGDFVEKIYKARYALSNYNSARKKVEATNDELEVLGNKARDALRQLASEEISLVEEPLEPKAFSDLPPSEKKRLIKSKITKDLNQKIKRYVEQTTDFDPNSCFKDFLIWLSANVNE